jgi:hypothetical protein
MVMLLIKTVALKRQKIANKRIQGNCNCVKLFITKKIELTIGYLKNANYLELLLLNVVKLVENI